MVGASHPFDLVKVRMQTTSSPTAYTSTLHAARTILAKDGITGLYRGVVPVLIGTPPVLATCMWAYYQGQLLASKLGGRRRKLQLSDTNLTPALVNTLSLPQIGFAGAFSALPTSFILGPAEQIKIRLQVQEQGSKSASQVIKEIVKEGGPKALFRGTGLTLMRDVPGSFFYFLTYEGVKRACGADRSTSINPAVVLLSGGETLASTGYAVHAGGKGANQSVAMAKAGAKVYHAGRVGRDGRWVVDYMAAQGVDTSLIRIDDEKPTGRAIIQVSTETSDNAIILHAGANHHISDADVEESLKGFGEGDWVVVQNEVNVGAGRRVVEGARRK
ncbi:hypothetical protein HK104_004154, partial [Borealophlyctis nickersoniae]